MQGLMFLAAMFGGDCHVQTAAVAVQPYAAAVAVAPVYFTWRVGEDEHQQQLLEKLIAIEEQNSSVIAALAKSSSGGEIGPVVGAEDSEPQALDAYVQESCVGCHNARRKDGDVDLSGTISKALWRRAAKEMAKGTMPKRGRKASAEWIDAAIDRASEE